MENLLFAFLQKLEAEFPEQPLLPESAALRDEAEALMGQAEDLSSAGFRYGYFLHGVQSVIARSFAVCDAL